MHLLKRDLKPIWLYYKRTLEILSPQIELILRQLSNKEAKLYYYLNFIESF